MDCIEKWLKSLRLHKYTHLFKQLTYDQMLNLTEDYLIEREVTKGARNKMLVSVKKLNLRQERLINMIDDLDQDNLSMKEALTVLKDMLITPIPPPPPKTPSTLSSAASTISNSSSVASSASTASTLPVDNLVAAVSSAETTTPPTTTTTISKSDFSAITTISCAKAPADATTDANLLANSSNITANNYCMDPYDLTYLFIETLEKVAHRLIESAGLEDNACHGIMAAIVDECLKHNSFTKEQKAKVAGFRQHFTKEQKAKVAGNFKLRPHTYNHHHYHQQQQQALPMPLQLQLHIQQQQKQLQLELQHQLSKDHHHNHHRQHQCHQQQLQHGHQHHHNQQHLLQHHNSNHHYHYHHHHNHRNGPIQPPSLTASLSTIGSASTSADEEERQTYREYSLLEPGKTFELPCLRSLAAAEKLNRRKLCFLSVFQSNSSQQHQQRQQQHQQPSVATSR